MSSSQMPSFTPGWNDPPTLINDKKVSGNHLLAQKHRRPVHPSIQSTPNFTSSYGKLVSNSLDFSRTMEMPPNPTNFNPHFHLGPIEHRPSIGSRPPVEHRPPMEHRSIYDVFTVPSESSKHDFAQIRPSISDSNMFYKDPAPQPQPFGTRFTLGSSAQQPQQVNSVVPTLGPPIESNPDAMIYTPPNAIESLKRPSTSPDHQMYNAPVKAAGDVSLSGPQLAQFMIKATFKLLPGVTRDGIQLRIEQFQGLARTNGISEGCLKKLNFIVDALDRGLYEEAMQFFEQFQASYQFEAKSGWAQGLRLLINELRKNTRIGSAGLAHN